MSCFPPCIHISHAYIHTSCDHSAVGFNNHTVNTCYHKTNSATCIVTSLPYLVTLLPYLVTLFQLPTLHGTLCLIRELGFDHINTVTF